MLRFYGRRWLLAGVAVGSAALVGCGGSGRASLGAAAEPARSRHGFVDVAQQSGVLFRHTNGAHGSHHMPETLGSGCAMFDADGDGDLDLLYLNGREFSETDGALPVGAPVTTAALYRNDAGKFTDITIGSGLDVPLYAMGCAVGDFDNDGVEDLYLTCAFEDSRLFHGLGAGRYEDVTRSAGVGNRRRWGASAAWFDFNGDGLLDLVVCNYLNYAIGREVSCTNRLGGKSYCTPRHYAGMAPTLYRNKGGGQFEDVTELSNVGFVTGKLLGVAVLDADLDGRPDLLLTSDTTPNLLLRNNGSGRFLDTALDAGVAIGENGLARAGMGVDVAELGRRGERAILIANYTNEPVSFFWESDRGYFVERTGPVGLLAPTLPTLGFGAFFLDYDNDGRQDIFLANGHVQDDIQLFQANLSYAQPHQLFRNVTEGPEPAFEERTAEAGPAFRKPAVSRGAAFGDYDGDGDLDLIVNNNGGAGELLRNDHSGAGHWLSVRLIGLKSNRSAYGARMSVKTAEGFHVRHRVSGSSYCSASAGPLHVGVGSRDRYDEIRVRWPSGRDEVWPGGPADRTMTLTEGSGKPAPQDSERVR